MNSQDDRTEATSRARKVMTARSGPGTDAQDSTVHLVPLPLDGDRNGPTALCGIRLHPGEIETVTPGEGTWCTMCFVCHVTGSLPVAGTTSGPTGPVPAPAAAAYRELGWPVSQHGGQLSVNLDSDVDAVALLIPALLGAEVSEILIRRRCLPPVLVHPVLPTYRIILAGDRYDVSLPWPTGVHRVTGTLLLPPTVTAYGPVRWIRPPGRHALKLCREIDVLAALSTALSHPPLNSGPTHF